MVLMFEETIHIIKFKENTQSIEFDLKLSNTHFGNGSFSSMIPLKYGRFMIMKSSGRLFLVKFKIDHSVIIYQTLNEIQLEKTEGFHNMTISDDEKYIFVGIGGSKSNGVESKVNRIYAVQLDDNNFTIENSLSLKNEENYTFMCFQFINYFGNKIIIVGGGTNNNLLSPFNIYEYDIKEKKLKYKKEKDKSNPQHVCRLIKYPDSSLRGYSYTRMMAKIEYI